MTRAAEGRSPQTRAPARRSAHRRSLSRRAFLEGVGAAMALGSAACSSSLGGADDAEAAGARRTDGPASTAVDAAVAADERLAAALAADARGDADASAAGGAARFWWRAPWIGGRSPYHRGVVNYGIMASAAYSTYKSRLGCEPDAAGGSTIYKAKYPPNTWARIIGGDYAAGVTASVANTLLDWAAHPNTSHTMGLPGAWVVPHGPTAPLGLPWEDFLALGAGTLRVDGIAVRDLYRRMGERIARHCQRNNKPLSEIVMRPNHEGMNQDTMFRLAPVNGQRQVYLVGQQQGFSAAQTTAAYNRAVRQWAEGLWAGAGYRIPIALSPAMQAQPGVPEIPYDDWMAGDAQGLYDLVCFSFHPTPARMSSDQKMHDIVHSATLGGFWTPAKALQAAQRAAAREGRSVAICTLEWSCRTDIDLQAQSLARYPQIVDLFYDFMEQHSDWVAFINLHAPQNALDPHEIDGRASAANVEHWKQYVARVIARHGRKA